jgi:hypothetical protein
MLEPAAVEASLAAESQQADEETAQADTIADIIAPPLVDAPEASNLEAASPIWDVAQDESVPAPMATQVIDATGETAPPYTAVPVESQQDDVPVAAVDVSAGEPVEEHPILASASVPVEALAETRQVDTAEFPEAVTHPDLPVFTHQEAMSDVDTVDAAPHQPACYIFAQRRLR